MTKNEHNIKFPVSFDNVPYFRNCYLGDLVILPEVIYYFPHTNIEGERNRQTQALHHGGLIHFGILGFALIAIINLTKRLIKTAASDSDALANRSQLKTIITQTDVSAVQKGLDDLFLRARNEHIKIGEFDLPKPMRFRKSEIKTMKTGRKLKFETEYDDHDFIIGFSQAKRLREVLWMAGFLR